MALAAIVFLRNRPDLWRSQLLQLSDGLLLSMEEGSSKVEIVQFSRNVNLIEKNLFDLFERKEKKDAFSFSCLAQIVARDRAHNNPGTLYVGGTLEEVLGYLSQDVVIAVFGMLYCNNRNNN